jgi:hypothetical protein
MNTCLLLSGRRASRLRHRLDLRRAAGHRSQAIPGADPRYLAGHVRTPCPAAPTSASPGDRARFTSCVESCRPGCVRISSRAARSALHGGGGLPGRRDTAAVQEQSGDAVARPVVAAGPHRCGGAEGGEAVADAERDVPAQRPAGRPARPAGRTAESSSRVAFAPSGPGTNAAWKPRSSSIRSAPAGTCLAPVAGEQRGDPGGWSGSNSRVKPALQTVGGRRCPGLAWVVARPQGRRLACLTDPTNTL